jgi:TRAP-type C4-dicarboxylate transport system substrate-binding protein
MNRKRSLTVSAILVVSTAIAACGGAAAVPSGTAATPTGALTKVGGNAPSTVKATLATVIGDGNDENDFADTLLGATGGTFDVTVASNWRQGDLTSETDLIKDVASGKVELGIVGTRAFDTVGVKSFEGLQVPFLIDSYDLEARVLSADWAKKLLDGPRSIGVVGLDYIQGPLRLPLGLTRHLSQASDFQGARIGIRPSHVSEMTMKALGATPVAWASTAGLDGIEMDVASIEGNNYDIGAKSLTGNLPFWTRPSVIFANATWFDGLPTDRQQQLRSAVAAVDQRAVTRVQSVKESLDVVCRRGLSIASASTAALDGLRNKTRSVTDELEKDPGTKATIDAILALRNTSGGSDTVGCSQTAASAAPSSGPTAIDGTWTTSFSKADLIASPFLGDQGEVNDENWGDWTFTFQNGRIAVKQSNNVSSSSSSGTFSVKGDAVTLAFDEGSNAGETFGYRWSIYKNTLTFKRDDKLGLPGPTPWLIKPWTRNP